MTEAWRIALRGLLRGMTDDGLGELADSLRGRPALASGRLRALHYWLCDAPAGEACHAILLEAEREIEDRAVAPQ